MVTFCPIRGVVESASIPLRCVFLLSAIIVLFAGWVGKELREKFSISTENEGKADFRYVTQQIVISLSYCFAKPGLCVLHFKVHNTNIALFQV